MLAPFREKVRAAGLTNRVHCPGRVSHEEVPGWLGAADVAVAPYPAMTHFYFSPLKIFEFFSLGLPVVSSSQGQVAELIPHRKRGYLYAPGDPEDLAQGIAHLLENREEARRLGQAGRDWVLSHATWEKRVGEILSRVEELS